MSENFLRVHPFAAKWEGGLDDDKYDAGGITHYGVSFAFLTAVAAESQANRETLHRMSIALPVTKDTIRALTRDQAQSLFQWQFWFPLKLDQLPIRVAAIMYDAAVNCGMGSSVKFGQRGCNAAGHKPQLAVDAKLGPLTLAALANADTASARERIIVAREDYYRAIVRNKPSQNRFLKGWLNRTRDLRTFIQGL